MDGKEFLGRGLSFPFRIDNSTGRVAMVSHEDDIRQSIGLILNTYRGERVMRPEFGARVSDYVFDEAGEQTGFKLKAEIEEALTVWEPRIRDIQVRVLVGKTAGSLDVSIDYTVRSTNTAFNVVYPFYLLEGNQTEDIDQ